MKRLLAVLLFLCGCTTARENRLVIAADRMLDVVSGHYVENAIVTISGDRIVSVTSGAAPKGALHVPTLLPGLIDAHTHLVWSSAPIDEAARATLDAGFTTVRNLGSDVSEGIHIAAPRVVFSGAGLGPRDGICHQTFGDAAVVTTADDARERVRSQVRDLGATWIKVCAGGGVVGDARDAETVELAPEILSAIVDEAQALKVKVAAHAQGPRAIQNAVRAGVDSIEHGGLIDRESALLMRQRDVVLVPTLARLQSRLNAAVVRSAAPDMIERLTANRARTMANVAEAIRVGVPIVLGTDATVLPHGQNAAEFSALVEAGLPPIEAVRAATTRAAQLLGMSDIGRIERGMFADLVGVAGDPLRDINALRDPVMVVMHGKVIAKTGR